MESLIVEVHGVEGEVLAYDLNALFASRGDVVTVGRLCGEVWNAIPLDSDGVDPFQCSIGWRDGLWFLSHGQTRTECPKGLRSDRSVPCNFCRGCCVNIHVANPVFFLREPVTPTLLNGKVVGTDGAPIGVGDQIDIGNVRLRVVAGR